MKVIQNCKGLLALSLAIFGCGLYAKYSSVGLEVTSRPVSSPQLALDCEPEKIPSETPRVSVREGTVSVCGITGWGLHVKSL